LKADSSKPQPTPPNSNRTKTNPPPKVAAMQRDSSTYCDEPDAPDYATWRAAFDLAAEEARIDQVVKGNALVAELQARLVPLLVERQDFWGRHFFRCVGVLSFGWVGGWVGGLGGDLGCGECRVEGVWWVCTIMTGCVGVAKADHMTYALP